MTTVAAYFKEICGRLSAATASPAEGEAAARILFEDIAGYDRKYIFMNGDREITDYMQQKIDRAVRLIENGEPVQYAVGSARFMADTFEVSPAVLIPRPETAGLVDMITASCGSRPDLRVLDIGTGSGCIAVELARALPFSSVEGIDISPDAIATAKANAARAHVNVTFSVCDILKGGPTGKYDIIVSNPPYVCESEKKDMDSRVVDYEPATALFVPDDDPLIFYRAIARYASEALAPGGRLFFEINERFPDEMRRLLESEGFVNVDITRDYKGKYRFASATLQ